jgi:tetratricopeptide (TPR) repeat protein
MGWLEMIQENNYYCFAINHEGFGSNALSNLVRTILLIVGLSFNTQVAVLAKPSLAEISSIYFNSDDSIVLETSSLSKLELIHESLSDENSVFLIPNAVIHGTIPRKIKTKNFEINLTMTKSQTRPWFATNDMVRVELKNLSGINIVPEMVSVFNGLAYQVNFISVDRSRPSAKTEIVEVISQPEQGITTVVNEFQDINLHKLNASLATRNLIGFTKHKTAVEEFLEDLDEDFFKEEVFIEETFQKMDSVSLSHIGAELEKRGKNDDAKRAYAGALDIDPSNINARLGFARISSDKEIKIKNYLASIDNQALVEIGKDWHKTGLDSKNPQLVSQSLVPFQLSVLKNPDSPESRFAYAKILEDSGPEYLYQASKRYLESAVLAKKLFFTGEEEYKSLLRKSTEALIRTLTVLGDQESALKYCNSYMGFGFSNFLDGRSVVSIIKEIKFNRNPFMES